MPKVGRKHFAYTKAGEKAAEEEAKKTGKPMTKKKKPAAKGKDKKLPPWLNKGK